MGLFQLARGGTVFLDEIGELEAAIQVVADTADGQDDTLAGRFGGRRYADL